jgi:hypothetical protein
MTDEPIDIASKLLTPQTKVGSALSRLSPHIVIRFSEILFVGLVFFVLTFRFFALISTYAVNVFFVDQWDFNDGTLFQHHTLWQMFDWQHGPPRLGVGALFEWLVDPLFRWNSRTESFVVGVVIVIATVCALWLKRKLYGRLSYSDAIIPLIFLSALQYETLFVAADFAHGPMPLILILLYCLAWTCDDPSLRYGLVLTINFLTIYTGFGLLLGLLTPLILAIDYWVNLRKAGKGPVYFVAPMLISLASFGSFFIGFKSQPAADCFSYQVQPIAGYVRFSVLMFAPFFGAQGTDALPTLIGILAVCALLAVSAFSGISLLRERGAQWTKYAVVTALTTYCLLFCMATAYGRLCLGMQFAQASRYVVYLNLGMLGLYFSLLMISDGVIRNMLVVFLGISLLGTIVSGERSRKDMVYWHDTKATWKNCYLATGNLKECNKVSWVYPGAPESTHLQEKLDFLKRTRQNLFADSK